MDSTTRPFLKVDEIDELVKEKGFWEALEYYFPDWRDFWRPEWVHALLEIDKPNFLLIRLRGQVEANDLEGEEFMKKYVNDMRDIKIRSMLIRDPHLTDIIRHTNTIHDLNVKIEKIRAYRSEIVDMLRKLLEGVNPASYSLPSSD